MLPSLVLFLFIGYSHFAFLNSPTQLQLFLVPLLSSDLKGSSQRTLEQFAVLKHSFSLYSYISFFLSYTPLFRSLIQLLLAVHENLPALAQAIYILRAQIPCLFMCSYYFQAKFLLESLSNNAEIFHRQPRGGTSTKPNRTEPNWSKRQISKPTGKQNRPFAKSASQNVCTIKWKWIFKKVAHCSKGKLKLKHNEGSQGKQPRPQGQRGVFVIFYANLSVAFFESPFHCMHVLAPKLSSANRQTSNYYIYKDCFYTWANFSWKKKTRWLTQIQIWIDFALILRFN